MNASTMHDAPVAAGSRVAVLEDRGVVAVSGADAESFLQGLLTNDTTGMSGGAARYAALLTPQGKILFDFLLFRTSDGSFLLDCPRDGAPDLARRLGFYKLRAKVTIEDRSMALAVVAVWGSDPKLAGEPGQPIGFVDPRHPDLGLRLIVPPGAVAGTHSVLDYEAHRLRLGVPKGGLDFAYGEAFPHEANLDRLHGLDFRKGCYVGQEVVSRVEHRGLARKRVVPVYFAAAPPAAGTEIFAGETSLGHMGSGIVGRGLAMLRLDRVAQARVGAIPLVAGATPVRLGEW